MSTPNIDAQIEKARKVLIEMGLRIGYLSCVKVGLAIVNKSVPKAPIDTGHLRNSSIVLSTRGALYPKGHKIQTHKKRKVIKEFLEKEENIGTAFLVSFLKKQKTPTALVSFVALYAPFVHEGNPSFNWNDGGPKFLERGVNEIVPLIPTIVRMTKEETVQSFRSSENFEIQDRESEE
jgi:hypothetical protein